MYMILFFGDPHGVFKHCIDYVNHYQPQAIVLLGDLASETPLEQQLSLIMNKTEVWWIPGNHDTDSLVLWQNTFRSELADRNLHGRVEMIAGKRIAGLGGVFRGEVWFPNENETPNYQSYQDYVRRSTQGRKITAHQRRHPLTVEQPSGRLLKHYSTIFPEDWDRLASQKADILVTHEALGGHEMGFEMLDRLALKMEVKQCFHGHHHEHLNYNCTRLTYHVFGVGIRGVRDDLGLIKILP